MSSSNNNVDGDTLYALDGFSQLLTARLSC